MVRVKRIIKGYFNKLLRDTVVYKHLEQFQKQQNEILKALIFNSTIVDSEWLKYKNFSPGKWAADYGLLYTLYRVLNGMNPKSIIEFGLGQSSKMIHQYANYYKKEAVTIEHDAEWVRFFRESLDGKYDINIKIAELQQTKYNQLDTTTYKEIDKIINELGGAGFDFILVDGPYGSPRYSRSQVIDIVRFCLHESFCIIMDDTDREGELETTYEIKKVLDSKGIRFCSCTYSSSKKHTLICSEDLRFLTSL